MQDLSNKKKILNDDHFVREKLNNKNKSAIEKYCMFTIGKYHIPELFKYEMITTLLGSLPGALGIALRRIFYKMLFKNIGSGVVFGRNVTIRCTDNIVIKNNVFIDDYCLIDGRGATEEKIIIGERTIINRLSYIQSKIGHVHIGSDVSIGTGSTIISQGGVEIGNWVSIAGGSKISGGLFKIKVDNEGDNPPFQRYTNGSICIGEYSIIGSGSVIIDGITVGKRCMVGPGSIVLKDIPDDTVVSAYPAMMIRKPI